MSRAVSALLSDRADLLLPLAAQLGQDQAAFESAVHGSSMAPAIPAGARIRVRLDRRQDVQVGDIVFYAADGGYTVHRVVHRTRRDETDYLLTAGDARFAPDAPLPVGQVLGTVVAVHVGGEWTEVAVQPTAPWHRRLVRAIALPAMLGMLRLSVAAAGRFAAVLLAVETWARLARRRLLHLFRRARFETALALSPVRNLVDRLRHPGVTYRRLDAARIDALLPVARRREVARAIDESLAASDNLVYFRNTSWYNWCHRHLPRGVPSLDDLYPPNLAVLDFLAHRLPHREREVLLDFPCGIGALLVYAQGLGLGGVHGFDNWTYLSRQTAERFLARFGVDGAVLVAADDLASLPVTILTCVGFPLPMLMESSSIVAAPSLRYVLADRMTRPMALPGFRRTIEYPGLLTVFERTA